MASKNVSVNEANQAVIRVQLKIQYNRAPCKGTANTNAAIWKAVFGRKALPKGDNWVRWVDETVPDMNEVVE